MLLDPYSSTRQDNKNPYYTTRSFNDQVMKQISRVLLDRQNDDAIRRCNQHLREELQFMLHEIQCISDSDNESDNDVIGDDTSAFLN